MAAPGAGSERRVETLMDVQQLLSNMPQREGQPVMVPFGPHAFFPGQLRDTGTVHVDRQLAGSGSSTTSGMQNGVGQGALVEVTAAEAAALVQSLVGPLPQTAQAATQQGPDVPQAAQHAQHGTAQQAQQLSDLVEGQTPEQLEALTVALQQLGAKLEAQQAQQAGGQPPITEGKAVVDIREEWSEEVHGAGHTASRTSPAAAAQAPAAAAAAAAAAPGAAAASSAAEGEAAVYWGEEEDDAASEGADSADSFEALMQRMEALEIDEAALAQAVTAQAAAAQAATRQAEAAVSAQKQGGGGGGFKRGFLLGKQLDPEPRVTTAAQATAAAAAGGRSGGGGGSAPAPTPQQEAEQERRREHEEDASRRREAAFTGRIVEREGPATAPDPASPISAEGAEQGKAAEHEFPGFPVLPRAGKAARAAKEQAAREQPCPPQQQPYPAQQEQPQAEQPQRMSRFKQRRTWM